MADGEPRQGTGAARQRVSEPSAFRWGAMPLPAAIEFETAGELVLGRDGYFDYEPVLDPAGGIEWHVNFADPHLFVAYGSSLFAQDEMQVAEHLALGALKEALAADCSRGEPGLSESSVLPAVGPPADGHPLYLIGTIESLN